MITKRIASPTFMPVGRKTAKFIVSPRNGKETMPLAVVMRDALGYAKNYKEAAKIIKSGQVMIDGVVRKDPSYGAGMMDVITVDFRSFRLVPSKKGLTLTEIDEKEAKTKLVRIDGKRTVSGGKTQLNMHDGTNVVYDKAVPTHDVFVVSLPDRKVQKTLGYKEGNLAVITDGKNAGMIGVIKEIHSVKGTHENKVILEVNGASAEFPEDYVFVVGESAPEITVTKSE